MTEEIVIQQDKKLKHNRNWKGDSVGYFGLHDYIRKHKSKPIDSMCEFCHVKPYRDLANVTGQYTRDFSNWKHLCKKCHLRFDFERTGRLIPVDRRCFKCGSSRTYIDKNGYHLWNSLDKEANLYQCRRCYLREYHRTHV